MKQTYNSVKGELPYAKPFIQYVDECPQYDRIVDEYQENRSQYRALKALKGRLRQAQRGEQGSPFEGSPHALARPLYVLAVASIQTPTPTWERAAARWLDGDTTLREFLNSCEDTGGKLDAIARVEETDLLERVDGALRGHHVLKAVRLLSGAEHDIRTYLRGAKAWMVPTLMFGVGCMDTNVHTAAEPILMWNLENEAIHHPSMNENQKGQARAKAKKWPKGKIPPYHHDWINERVSRYNSQSELAALWEVVETVFKGSVPRDILPQVMFNVGGREQSDGRWNTTIHQPIYEALGRNLERFEA